MRKYINLVESLDEIIPDEHPRYNTLAKQLAAVSQDGYIIEYIKNPCEQVQIAAVRRHGLSIQFIPNPSERVQLEAVEENMFAFKQILDKGIVPSIAVQRAAVLNSPKWALYHMIDYNIPISKMIQWIAAKRLKELKKEKTILFLSKLDPDVQNFLRIKS